MAGGGYAQLDDDDEAVNHEQIRLSGFAQAPADAPGEQAAPQSPGTEGACESTEEEEEEEEAPTSTEAGLALFSSIEDGADEAVILRMLQEADRDSINSADKAGQASALLLSLATAGHLEAVRYLLSREDFDGVNARYLAGTTALHQAAVNGHLEICRELLACPRFTLGVNATTNRGQTALDFCREFGGSEAAELLVAAGATSVRRNSRSSVALNFRTVSAEHNFKPSL
eukprot:TRINITY_DN24491_c0_g1_i1.p1 TRINITY_DN24491_c0_g1~~TRINITY_DN24491_c0_g1_i1.p1  ORF type:complete len:229 (-),score=55.85 TRINITY_DN24491_c0_g1_i1:486-1172(-)